jgi:aryl-alcohol dehydrogenase-like predicted oxidoreductase
VLAERDLGATGVRVSALGLGGGALGEARVSEREAEALLLGAVDMGVTLIDTARSYGSSEERIGRLLGARRDRVVLSTKGGYGAHGAPDWTGEAIARGIDEALARLRTDRIDLFHLHSCPLETLRRDDILRALDDARSAGKIRVAAYSGENDALSWAIESARFGSVQCSVNLFDQRSLETAIANAAARGVGVVAKRALANAPWRFDERPAGHYCETYWSRMRAMQLDPSPLAWLELAVRFAAHAPGVASILVGTASVDHLRACALAAAQGPLPAELEHRVRAAFRAADPHGAWTGEV